MRCVECEGVWSEGLGLVYTMCVWTGMCECVMV